MMSHGSRLDARADALDRALQVAADRVDPAVAEQVRDIVAGARERLALGVDHTVVALAGGTGSGKSSLFNMISRTSFAEVGALRPTTDAVSACSWSGSTAPLLDWLGVRHDRRADREGALEGAGEARLRGLVLLDLPDHDSVERSHRETVDRLLPMADLVVCVVDPQKYADHALHARYLRGFAGPSGSLLVVLNQIDTVPYETRAELLADVSRVLAEDGLPDVPVLGVSARTAEGVPVLRDAFADVVSRRGVAAGRVAAELDRAARLLMAELDAAAPRTVDELTTVAVEEVARVVGLDALAEAAGRGTAHWERDAARLEVHPVTVEPVRAAWLAAVDIHLTPRWRDDVEAKVESAEDLARAAREAVSTVHVPPGAPELVRATGRGALVVAAAAVLTGILTVAGWAGVGGLDGAALSLAITTGLLVVTAGVLGGVSRSVRRRDARMRSQEVLAEGGLRLRRAVEGSLAVATQAVLDEHNVVKELAELAVDAPDDPGVAQVAGAARGPV